MGGWDCFLVGAGDPGFFGTREIPYLDYCTTCTLYLCLKVSENPCLIRER